MNVALEKARLFASALKQDFAGGAQPPSIVHSMLVTLADRIDELEGRAGAIAVGDVVQIDPEHDDKFGGNLLVVTEVKSWGVQGYVAIPGSGLAYYRVHFESVRRIGVAAWTAEPDLGADEVPPYTERTQNESAGVHGAGGANPSSAENRNENNGL